MRATFLLLFLASFCFSQEKTWVVVNKQNQNITHLVSFWTSNKDSLFPIQEFNRNSYADNRLLHFEAKNYLSFSDFFGNLKNQDTIFLYREVQEIEEVNIVETVRRKESEDSLHVVDFHFVHGKLFTLEKPKRNLGEKWIHHENYFVKTDSKSKLLKSNLNGYYLENDTVFYLNENQPEFLMREKEFSETFREIMGKYHSNFFYKTIVFYGLITEYSIFNEETKEKEPIYHSFDKESMFFISQQYNKPTPVLETDPPIGLFYTNPHKFAGKRFTNNENISFVNFSLQEGQLFKYLVGNGGFTALLSMCSPSFSEGILIDSVFYIVDFSNQIVHRFPPPISSTKTSFSIPDITEITQYETRYDYATKKVYHLVKSEGNYQF